MDQHRRALRQVHGPAQVVGDGPVVVLAVDVEQVERPGPAGAGLRRVLRTSSTDPSTPAPRTCCSNLVRVGVPPNSRPSTNGSIATSRLPLSPSAEASTIVDRPWWLPISRASEPGRACWPRRAAAGPARVSAIRARDRPAPRRARTSRRGGGSRTANETPIVSSDQRPEREIRALRAHIVRTSRRWRSLELALPVRRSAALRCTHAEHAKRNGIPHSGH